MSLSNPNRSPATLTKNRVKAAPGSGICVTCLDSCPGPCEIGRSAIRGREMLYPQPFGNVTAGADKDYPVDFSHFNVQGYFRYSLFLQLFLRIFKQDSPFDGK